MTLFFNIKFRGFSAHVNVGTFFTIFTDIQLVDTHCMVCRRGRRWRLQARGYTRGSSLVELESGLEARGDAGPAIIGRERRLLGLAQARVNATGQVHGYRHTGTRWITYSLYQFTSTNTPLQNSFFCGGVVTLTCFSYISWFIVNFQVSINVFLNLYCYICLLAMQLFVFFWVFYRVVINGTYD